MFSETKQKQGLITDNSWLNKRGTYFYTRDQVGLDNFSPLITEIIIWKLHLVFTQVSFVQC